MVFKGLVDSRSAWDRALNFCNEFRIHNLCQPALIPRTVRQSRWEKPSVGILKINFYVAWENKSIGIGLIARDEDGFVHGGAALFKQCAACPAWGEAEGLMQSITWAKQNDVSGVMFEGDCADIINRLNSSKDDITLTGFVLENCKKMLKQFDYFKIKWVPRNCNKVADKLSELALGQQWNMSFNLEFLVKFRIL